MDSYSGIQMRSSVCADPPFFQIKNMGYKIFKGLDHLLTYIKKRGEVVYVIQILGFRFPLMHKKKMINIFYLIHYLLLYFNSFLQKISELYLSS